MKLSLQARIGPSPLECEKTLHGWYSFEGRSQDGMFFNVRRK